MAALNADNRNQDINLDIDAAETEELIDSETKPIRLSLHLIVKRHLPKDASEWPQEKMINELNKIKRVRLDRENIGEIDSLELFSTQVSNLYLQSNKISSIQNLECLPNLQVLVLSNNKIRNISGISHLEKLILLDMSENCLEIFDCDELPKNIIILNLSGNAKLDENVYRPDAVRHLPKLKQLNNSKISVKEKIAARILADGDEQLDDEEESYDEDDNDGKEGEIDKDDDADGIKARKGDGVSSMNPPLLGMADTEDLLTSSYKQLPRIENSIQGLAADMLVRSQQRLEDVSRQHKKHLQQITNIRIKSKIKPIPQISRPY